jgi:hypothetical protein
MRQDKLDKFIRGLGYLGRPSDIGKFTRDILDDLGLRSTFPFVVVPYIKEQVPKRGDKKRFFDVHHKDIRGLFRKLKVKFPKGVKDNTYTVELNARQAERLIASPLVRSVTAVFALSRIICPVCKKEKKDLEGDKCSECWEKSFDDWSGMGERSDSG